MTTAREAIEATLLALADGRPPLHDQVFAQFFAAFPDERARFYNEEAARARMTDETLAAMHGLAAGDWWVPSHMATMVDLHRNYGPIAAERYAAFIDIVLACVRDACGSVWTPAAAAAWKDQATALKALIDAAIADAKRLAPAEHPR